MFFKPLSKVCKLSYPDATQFEANSKYFDQKAISEFPIWLNVDVKLISKNR
ncbi:MAG: hypothetical protein CMH70_08975 [Nitrosomonadaceae bacterium]|nr:hypothetical protein [Nitrosomonadaceae bacterium]